MKTFLSGIVIGSFSLMLACHGNESASPQAATSDSSYAIIGKVTGLDTGLIILNHRQTEKNDTALLDHGYFTYKGKADTAEVCSITLGKQSKRFFLENGKI